jgi:threonine/homoserine/homoserine lactone efflux protein
MHSLPLAGISYLLGFVTAVPIGASQIEVAKRALAMRPGAALLSASGSITSDMMYGFLALFGLAPFLEKPHVLGCFQAIGSAVLVFLAFYTWRQSQNAHSPEPNAAWTGAGTSYLTGLVLGLTYPPIMFVWLAGCAFMRTLGWMAPHDTHQAVLFVLGGSAGLFSYLALITFILYRTHHFYSQAALQNIYRALSILLGLIAIVFIVQCLKHFQTI